ncbi:hypothetical protein G7Y89_g6807 [Cudoniella acicularis]|uniref:Uncharacterized protein n=1 Tax=Cudoniella acicularis TaxID=354080 RepID=A0A8H4W239_9HELO|nr:hypothetical protein G7Y89_g6807 [Cudoniella acicularis]
MEIYNLIGRGLFRHDPPGPMVVQLFKKSFFGLRNLDLTLNPYDPQPAPQECDDDNNMSPTNIMPTMPPDPLKDPGYRHMCRERILECIDKRKRKSRLFKVPEITFMELSETGVPEDNAI